VELAAPEPGRDKDHSILGDRRGNRVHVETVVLPHEPAGLEVVAPHPLVSGRDHLGAAVVLHHERRAPRVDVLPLGAPDLLARGRVERDDERGTLMVPHDNELVAVQNGRASGLANLGKHTLVAEMLLPEQCAVDVVGVQTA
jgi:hypothetical protein